MKKIIWYINSKDRDLMKMIGQLLADRQMIYENSMVLKTEKGEPLELFEVDSEILEMLSKDKDFRIEKNYRVFCKIHLEDFVREWKKTAKSVRSKAENEKLAELKESSVDVLFEDGLIGREIKLPIQAALESLGALTVKKLLFLTPRLLLEVPRIGKGRVSKLIQALLIEGFLPGEYPLLDCDYLIKYHKITLGTVKS